MVECNYPDKICEYMTVLHGLVYCDSTPCGLNDKNSEATSGNFEELKNKRSLKDILENYYKFHGTKDLAVLFENFMQEIGAKKLDRRKKDTAHTYKIDGDDTGWNQVQCYYYKNGGDWKEYGKFDFCITLRKGLGDYLRIEIGNSDAKVKLLYEISCGRLLCYDRELLLKMVRRYPELFVMLCNKVK